MESDVAYYTRRAGEERSAAMLAAHKAAKLSHLELALAYEYRVRLLVAEENYSPAPIVEHA